MIRVPSEIRARWNEKQKQARFNDIFEVEAIGPLLILENFESELRGCVWLHFIDNAASLSALVRGSSSVLSGEQITGLTWCHIAGLSCYPWFNMS